jgi:hypothetical protein
LKKSADGLLQDPAILVRRQLPQHSNDPYLDFGSTILLLCGRLVNGSLLLAGIVGFAYMSLRDQNPG